MQYMGVEETKVVVRLPSTIVLKIKIMVTLRTSYVIITPRLILYGQ